MGKAGSLKDADIEKAEEVKMAAAEKVSRLKDTVSNKAEEIRNAAKEN